jgi:hypothetical protein
MRVTDMLTQQTRGISVKTLITLGLISPAGAAVYGCLWFATIQSRELAVFVAVYSGGFAITWFAILFAKLSGKAR